MRVISIPLQEEPDFVISLARIAVNTYSIVRGHGIGLINEIIFAPLKFVIQFLLFLVKIIAIIASLFFLLFLVTGLILILCFGNTLFYLNKNGIVKVFAEMDRKMLINKHLKFEKSLRDLNKIKRSKFLFKSPLLGRLSQTFYNNIQFIELELRTRAYPNLNQIPDNLPIHELSDSDVWQDDLGEYSREEILTLQ